MKLNTSAFTHIFIRLLFTTLVLAAFGRPAEGFVLYEQHASFDSARIPELKPNSTQTVMDLSGPWQYQVGAHGSYHSGWIPSCFADGETVVAFKRSFVLPDSLRNWNVQLFLPEISYSVQVYLNGSFIGTFTGNHLGYSCDLARDHLRFGQSNDLILKVDNLLTAKNTLPLAPQLLHPRNYGGVFSGAFLRMVRSWSIEDVYVEPVFGKDTMAVEAKVHVHISQHFGALGTGDAKQTNPEAKVFVTLDDTLGHPIVVGQSEVKGKGADDEYQLAVTLPLFRPQFWSPEQPKLYQLTSFLVIGSDTVHKIIQRTGFKRLEISAGSFKLNGQKLRLRAIDYVPEYGGSGTAISPTIIRSDLLKIKALNINAIRVPFGAPPPYLASLADEMGFLLLVEGGLDWIPAKITRDAGFKKVVEHSIGRLVSEYRDNISVMAWGIGSQYDWNDPSTDDFVVWVRSIVKALDERPCYVESFNPSASRIADFVLVSRNPRDGTEQGSHFYGSDRPVIVSRVGYPATFGATSLSSASNGIVTQADYLIRQITELDGDADLDGFIVHAFCDYHGNSPLAIQPGASDPFRYSYGIVDIDRQERIAYFKLHDLAQTGKATPLVPTDVPEEPPSSFPLVGLAGLLLLFAEYRRNNVFRQNLRRVLFHAHGFYSDIRYRRFLHLGQPLLLLFIESLTLAVLTGSLLYAVRLSFKFDYVLSLLLPWPGLKAALVNLIWNPPIAIIYLTALFMAKILVGSGIIRLFSMIFRGRVDFWQSTNYILWSFVVVLFLLPVAILFNRVLDVNTFLVPAVFATVAAIIWSLIRLLSALRIGFGATAVQTYGVVVGLLGLVVVIVLALMQNSYQIFTYLQYFNHVFGGRAPGA